MRNDRYYETPTYYSFLQLPNKKKLPKYPENQPNTLRYNESMKLPSLSNSTKQNYLFTERNTTNQLKNLGDKAQKMQKELYNTRMQANEIMGSLKYLKEQMLDGKLKKEQNDMKQQIEGLRNLLCLTKQSHEDRSNSLRQNYIDLWNKTESLKEEIHRLRKRIDTVDDVMGMKNF